MLRLPTSSATFDARVDVTFANGTTGHFVGVFETVSQREVEGWVESGTMTTEMLSRVLKGAREIDDGQGGELAPDKGRELVLESPECCARAKAVFFERISGKSTKANSKK